MADTIDTGGGPAVSGNADSGRDFVGRDHNTYNTHAPISEKQDWVAFFLMEMRGDVSMLRRSLEELRQEQGRMDTKIDRNHDHTAARFVDADVKFTDTNSRLAVIWMYVLANTAGGILHLLAIVALAIFVYLLWITVHSNPLAILHALVAWRPW